MEIKNNYNIEGFAVLLNEDCISERYYPLIPYRDSITCNLAACGCRTKADCQALTDAEVVRCGLPEGLTALFRRFLCLYDCKGKGIKDIPNAEKRSIDEICSLAELMRLPGVKAIRAELYLQCGYKSLIDIAKTDATTMRGRIAECIASKGLSSSLPQPKELRTQIAVAKVLTDYDEVK